MMPVDANDIFGISLATLRSDAGKRNVEAVLPLIYRMKKAGQEFVRARPWEHEMSITDAVGLRLLAPASAGSSPMRQMVCTMVGSPGNGGAFGISVFSSYSHYGEYRKHGGSGFTTSMPLYISLDVGRDVGSNEMARAAARATATVICCQRTKPDMQETCLVLAALERLPGFWRQLTTKPIPAAPGTQPLNYEPFCERLPFDPAGLETKIGAGVVATPKASIHAGRGGGGAGNPWEVELFWPASSAPIKAGTLLASKALAPHGPRCTKQPGVWPALLPSTATLFAHVAYHRQQLAREEALTGGKPAVAQVPRRLALAFALMECYEPASHEEALGVALGALQLVSGGQPGDDTHADATVGLLLELAMAAGEDKLVLAVLALHDTEYPTLESVAAAEVKVAQRDHSRVAAKKLPLPMGSELIFWTAALVWYRAKGPTSKRARRALAIAVDRSPFVARYLTGMDTITPKAERGNQATLTFRKGSAPQSSKNSAASYVENFMSVWRRQPGAIEWVRARTIGAEEGGAAQKKDKVKGSGKKAAKKAKANRGGGGGGAEPKVSAPASVDKSASDDDDDDEGEEEDEEEAEAGAANLAPPASAAEAAGLIAKAWTTAVTAARIAATNTAAAGAQKGAGAAAAAHAAGTAVGSAQVAHGPAEGSGAAGPSAEKVCCSQCGRIAELKACACKAVRYCSESCQRAQWKRHKEACQRARAAAGARANPDTAAL
jgi:hypothetical protein